MPKAKPTQVIVHRLELQETERSALEAALAGNFVTNAVSAAGSVLTGFGNMLTPFTGVLTAIGAAYIAEKGLTGMVAAIDTVKETIPLYNPKNQASAYEYLVSFLQANPEWDSLGSKTGRLKSDLEGMKASPILLTKLLQWIKTIASNKNRTGNWPTSTPAKHWMTFYSPQDFLSDSLSVINPLS